MSSFHLMMGIASSKSSTSPPSRSSSWRGVRSLGVTVKAMGGGVGKYKGTQMREKKLTEMIEKKVMEAKAVCEGEEEGSDECRVAWDEVEEISQAKANLRLKLQNNQDPLHSFCQQNPLNDECSVE